MIRLLYSISLVMRFYIFINFQNMITFIFDFMVFLKMSLNFEIRVSLMLADYTFKSFFFLVDGSNVSFKTRVGLIIVLTDITIK